MSYTETTTQAPSTAPATKEDVVSGIGELHVDFAPLKERWDIKDSSRDDMLKSIWEYAKEMSPIKDSKDAIMLEVSRLANRLGSVGYGEKPWIKVYQYVSTWKQMKDADKRLKELENG